MRRSAKVGGVRAGWRGPAISINTRGLGRGQIPTWLWPRSASGQHCRSETCLLDLRQPINICSREPTSIYSMDQRIRSLVSALRHRGIRTTGSCEGHISHGAPAPWVKVTPPKAKRKLVLRATVQYLNAFYANRSVPKDVRFVVERAHFGFWIHNGGDGYDRWRVFVNECVGKIRRGKEIRSYIEARERNRRSERLPAYQYEARAFAKFLRRAARGK